MKEKYEWAEPHLCVSNGSVCAPFGQTSDPALHSPIRVVIEISQEMPESETRRLPAQEEEEGGLCD